MKNEQKENKKFVPYTPLSDDQTTEIWRKADKGAFGEDSEIIMKLAEDVMTYNAERRLTQRVPDSPKAVAQDWVDGKLVEIFDNGSPRTPASG